MIERLLGRGGMAEVYAARDTHLRRLVALKRLRNDRDDSAATARLLREARAAASFQHPGAVVVYDVFEHEGAAYMAMELVSGRTLRSYVGDASIPIEKRLRWLVDVARALGAAHRAGLVHRDVKPHNVMVRDDGTIKVLDFGIARAHHRAPLVGEDTSQSLGTLTDTGAVVGTPLYASPEQLSAAAVDERSDQFAWAVMGYELCCGLLPWRRRDTLTMLAQLVSEDIPTMLDRIADAASLHKEAASQSSTSRSAPPPPLPDLYTSIPDDIEPVLRRAMRRDPAERFPTIDDAADMLEEHAEAPPSVRYMPRSMFPALEPPADALGRSGATPAAREEPTGPTPGTGRRSPTLGTPRSPGTAMSAATPQAATSAPVAPSATSGPPSGGTPRSPGQVPDASAPQSPPSTVPAPPSSASAFPISDTRSTTGGRIATGGTTADAGPRPSEPPRSEDEPSPRWRRTMGLLAGAAFLAAAAVGVASWWQDRQRSGPPPAAASASAAPSITRVTCAPAQVRAAPESGSPATKNTLSVQPAATGQQAAPNPGALHGQAACVRLAIALGVPWQPGEASGSPPLVVSVETTGTTKVTVSLAGQTASAEAPRPLAAVDAATRALASMLGAPSVGADRQAELGVAGEPAARRMEAVLRRRAARLAEDPAAELSEAMSLAPRSPWPRLLALPDAVGSQRQRLRDDALAGIGALPEPLAEAARGTLWLRAPGTDTEREGAMSALRRAYAARPEDGLVAAALAEALLGAGLHEEAAAVGLRIAERAPAQSLPALTVLVSDATPDPAWVELRGRLIDALEALLPEARGWDTRALHEALAGRVEQARASLALGESLGLPSATGRAWARDLARAAVEIAGDQPAAARALVQPFLGSPSPAEAALATRLLVQAHLLEGHAGDAETALARDIARLDALGDRVRAAERWITLLGIRRRLDLPPSDFADVNRLEALASALEAAQSPLAPSLRAEIFLLQLARREKAPADAAEVQRAIEAYARKLARGDRARQDDLAAGALPLALASSGPTGLRSSWASLDRARFSAKLPHQLLYGIASEKAGDHEEAERAYRAVASAPLSVDGIDHLSARVRLARLLEKAGRKDEAAKWRVPTDRILKNADRGLVRALERDP